MQNIVHKLDKGQIEIFNLIHRQISTLGYASITSIQNERYVTYDQAK